MRKLIFILIALISFSQAQTIQYIGAPTTTVISRGNFRTDSIFYLPKRTKTPTDTAAFRYQISDSSLYYWTGYQWTKVQSASSFASVDTTVISTRAYRQKGIDSVQYNVGLKVNISDTASMLSPYIVGSGTSNYFPKFNASRSVINSKLYESNLNLLFNSTTPYLTTSGISTIENNGTSAALYVLKTLDTARAYVSFGGANTMDINNLRAGDIRFYTNATLRGRFQTDGTFRLNSLTGTGSRIVVADDNGVLSATSSATGLVDTTLLSTRAYRQKGDDSLGAIIATKGSGTVTSVATGYGLSGGTITTTGTLIADTLNLSTRAWRQKGLDSLAALEISGSGTTNYVPKFTNTRELGNSQIFDNGTNVGINTASPSYKLDVNGVSRSQGGTALSTAIFNNTGFDGGIDVINSGTLALNRTSQLRLVNGTSFLSTNDRTYQIVNIGESSTAAALMFQYWNGSTYNERVRLNSGGELLINTTTDAGAYTLQNNGALYNTGSAILAATSGGVTMGSNTSALSELDIYGTTSLAFTGFRAQQLIYSTEAFNANPNASIGFVNKFTSGGGYGTLGSISVGKENATDGNASGYMSFYTYGPSALTEKMRINSSGETLFGTTTDAGNYRVQVSGNSYISGALDIGTTTNRAKMTLIANNEDAAYISNSGSNTIVQMSNNNTTGDLIYRLRQNAGAGNFFDIRYYGSSNYLGFDYGGNNAISISSDRLVGVGTTTPSASAQLDVASTTRGFLPPRMTTAQRDAISSPAAGLVIYNTTTSKLQVYTTSWTDLH